MSFEIDSVCPSVPRSSNEKLDFGYPLQTNGKLFFQISESFFELATILIFDSKLEVTSTYFQKLIALFIWANSSQMKCWNYELYH